MQFLLKISNSLWKNMTIIIKKASMFGLFQKIHKSYSLFGYPQVLRYFASKNKSKIVYTDQEKKRLEQVFLDDEIAKFFKWKRYPINDDVIFDNEADFINWENRRIGNGSITKAREIAEMEELDVVLVKKNPPIVRFMNYKNWILRWALNDRELNAAQLNRGTTTYMRIGQNILPNDLEYKLARAIELVDSKKSVMIESQAFDTENPEEITDLKIFEKKLWQKLKEKIKGNSVLIDNRSVDGQIRIFMRVTGLKMSIDKQNDENKLREGSAYQKEHKLPAFTMPDEDAFMENILSGGIVAETEDQYAKNNQLLENKYIPINYDKEETIKQKIITMLGADLASKFMKGRFSLK